MDVYEDALKRLERLDRDDRAIARMMHPMRMTEVHIPVVMDDGEERVFKAWRCQYNDVLGPTKGGIRFHPDANPSEVKALAMWMALKTALMELPFGGGKGGVEVDTSEMSDTEEERLSKGYVRALFDTLGPDQDVPAPDVRTGPKHMLWMRQEYEAISRTLAPASFTGKPVAAGGSKGRDGATATGAAMVLEAWMQRNERDTQDLTVAIQGFGSAGRNLARILNQAGYKIVAVSDSSGGIHDPEGLPVDAVAEAKKQKGSVTDFDGGKKIDNEALLLLEVDILIPAALEGVITEDNAKDVDAKIILEVANGPLSAEADLILQKAGVTVIPDILTNAGGVTVSYYEWIQGRTGEYWSADDVQNKLQARMDRRCQAVFNRAQAEDLPLRDAAYMLALDRIADAMP